MMNLIDKCDKCGNKSFKKECKTIVFKSPPHPNEFHDYLICTKCGTSHFVGHHAGLNTCQFKQSLGEYISNVFAREKLKK
jgi:hypothetical protein